MEGYMAGAGRSVITPGHSVELSGFGDFDPREIDPAKRRFSEGRLGDENLFSKTAIIGYGDKRIALISVDLVGLRKEEVKKIRNKVNFYTGIPEDYIMVACTNTHSGPATIPLRLCGEMDPEYMEKLPELVAKSAKSIKIYPTDILANTGILEGVSYNRENHVLDNELFAIFSKPFTIARFSCKPCVLERRNKKFSRDYPGVVSDYLEQIGGFGEFLFLNGVAGDAAPIIDKERKGPKHIPGTPYPIGYDELRGEDYVKIGRKIAELKKNASPTGPGISVSSRIIVLRFDMKAIESGNYKIDPKRESSESIFYQSWKKDLDEFWESKKSIPPGVPAEIQAIRLGDYVLVVIPGEVMAETGLQIKQKYPNAIVVGFANDQIGYIPTREKIEKNTYTAVHGPRLFHIWPLAPEVGDILLEGVDSVIDDVSLK